MQKVVKGQVWSVLSTYCRNRIQFEVQRVERDGKNELRAFGIIVGGIKEISFTVSSLSRGLRGARIVLHADGHEPYEPERVSRVVSTATASDFRKIRAPRGVATASPRMEEAFSMREGGASLDDIAEHFGVNKKLVSSWCTRVREKREDDAARRILEGGQT
jgi:hypothetical protein